MDRAPRRSLKDQDRMSVEQIAATLAVHRAQADSWSWWCSCGAGEALSVEPVARGVNPGKYREADLAAREHVARMIAA